MDVARFRTQAATRRLEGTLRLGLLFPTSGGPHLTEIIEVFSDRNPAGVIQVSEVLLTDGLGPLQRGEIDILATRLPIKRPDLVVGPTLSRESRVLAIAHGHPLARRERISIEDIADYEVLPLSEFPHEMIEDFIPHRTPTGKRIRRICTTQPPRTPHELIAHLIRGSIVHPTVPSFAEYFGHPDLVYIPIVDMPPSKTGLAWRRRATDPLLREFIRIARKVLQSARIPRS